MFTKLKLITITIHDVINMIYIFINFKKIPVLPTYLLKLAIKSNDLFIKQKNNDAIVVSA